jgi:monosaccharide-transporting ATPase
MPSAEHDLLSVQGMSKRFPGVQALDGVNFSVRAGEIHALMGENGAGKSTLIKVLTGVYPGDAGSVRCEGREINPGSPKEAERDGISTVYQEVNLIPHLSVAENICLGREPTAFGLLRWREMGKRAVAALARLDLKLDVWQELASCSIAIQQMVAIARALDTSAKLLILDEPTSSLDSTEVEELFAVLRRLRSKGMGIVFVTHFLDQVYAVTDRITVLRDGKLVGTYATSELPRLQLVSKMVGKEVSEFKHALATPGAEKVASEATPFIDAKNLGRKGSIEPVNIVIRKGEVVGLAGLLGSGRTETARLLFGVDHADSGEVLVDGVPLRLFSPRSAIRAKFAFTSENRKLEGIIPHMSVRENMILAVQGSRGPWRALPRRTQEEIAAKFIKAIGIKTPTAEQEISKLSGGNQQKVLLARWLANEPRLFILDEPTRGIDVGAKAEIEKLIASLCEQGLAILFISSELEEVVRTCDRVYVLRDRKQVAELEGEQVSEQTVMQMIARHTDA